MAKPPPRLWTHETLAHGVAFSLSKDQAHYLGTVLRLSQGDTVLFFNGRDGEWAATISQISRKSALIDLKDQVRAQPEKLIGPALFFAPLKKGPTDLIVQKATELGACTLQPVLTERTTNHRVASERLQLIAREAAEQCERLHVPSVEQPIKLGEVLLRNTEIDHILFCDEAGDDAQERWGGSDGRAPLPFSAFSPDIKVKERADDRLRWAVLIGPEGGFTPKEREILRATPKAVPISLGPRILKAETAAIVALTLWQLFLGDMRAGPVS